MRVLEWQTLVRNESKGGPRSLRWDGRKPCTIVELTPYDLSRARIVFRAK